jgi:CubicO group peptidase (beta-lactamase class C family)
VILLERGELELEAPVARYWPDFGKEEIRVRDILGHTARLPGIETPTRLADLLHDRRMAAALAAQAPSADPRAGLCYDAITYGWLCGELVRRISGRSVGRFVADEVADPLELEIWIGLPEEHEERVATMELWSTWPATAPLRRESLDRDALLRSIWGNPPVLDRDSFPWNERAFHPAEIPALGAMATARSVARLYANLTRLLSGATIELGATTLSNGWDEAHGAPRHFGVGFELQTELQHLGPPRDAFGHGGAGGSIHGCWPRNRIGFSYATNLLRDDEGDDSRAQALLRALHHAAGGAS